MLKGKCSICGDLGSLTIHHVVEAVVENDEVPKIVLCSPCHDQQEKYRNNLLNNCGIDIDRTKKS